MSTKSGEDPGRERMRRISRGKLAAEKIEAVIESAYQTIGVPCVAAEREYLMALGAELRHSREQKGRVGLRLSARNLDHGMFAARVRNDAFQLRHHGVVDPRIAALCADECRNSSDHHDSEFQIHGEGRSARMLFVAAKRTTSQVLAHQIRAGVVLGLARHLVMETHPAPHRA